MTLEFDESPAPLSAPPAAAPEPQPVEAPPQFSPRALELAAMSPARAAIELAWPGILEQFVRASGQTVSLAIVGQLGAFATAAMGASGQFLFLLFPIWGALSTGTVALVSRRIGEGRIDAAADVVRQSLLLATVLGIVSGAGFVVFARPLLALIGAAPEVIDAAAPFLALVGGLNIFQTLSIIGVNALRAAGDARAPMWLSFGASALVIPLTYVLVFGLGAGVMGAAYAQVGVAAAFLAVTATLMWRGRAGLRIAGGPWAFQPAVARSLMSISLPSMAETLLFSIGLLALSGIVFRLGTDAFAAHQILSQVEAISFLPCVGFSAAAAALVGQSLGMHQPKRAMTVGWAAARMAALWTSVAGMLFVLLPGLWLGLFTSSTAVVAAGVGAMVIVGVAQPAQAVIFTIGGALRGAGDTRYTLAVTIVNWFLVRFPLALVLGLVVGWGLAGVWAAVAIDYFVRAGLMGLRFRSGAWARRSI